VLLRDTLHEGAGKVKVVIGDYGDNSS
jgi:hypothetical protein